MFRICVFIYNIFNNFLKELFGLSINFDVGNSYASLIEFGEGLGFAFVVVEKYNILSQVLPT